MNSGTPESNYGFWFPGKENDGAAGWQFMSVQGRQRVDVFELSRPAAANRAARGITTAKLTSASAARCAWPPPS